MSRAERSGLTLLEVLAAVALLGLVYVALSRNATLGIIHEGESRRRLEASLLADQVLGEIELQIAAGSAPPVGENETVVGDFAVRIETTPLEVPAALLEALGPPTPGAPSLFQSASPAENALRRVLVRVSWFDLLQELAVERESFAYDGASLAAATGPPLEGGGPLPTPPTGVPPLPLPPGVEP